MIEPRAGVSPSDGVMVDWAEYRRWGKRTLIAIDLSRSRVRLRNHMKQIPQGKQRETKNGAHEIEVVTNAMLVTPMHPRKQMKGFANMGKDDNHQTSCAE